MRQFKTSAILFALLIPLATGAESGAIASQTAATAASGSDQGCLTNPAALEDLKRREEKLRDDEAAVKARSEELDAQAKALEQRVADMEELKKTLEKLETARSAKREEQVTKMVETLERMSPKASSKLLAEVDEALAVEAISRMSTERLAKVMNTMDAAKASRLTELLAGFPVKKRRPASGAKTGGQSS